jgi:hypothetical protein
MGSAGRKSVGCIMLLTLGKHEFPVDTNVGRIAARLGWLPLDSAQTIEDLDEYAPEPEVHAYLHSRLLGFGVETLYELHYQMITLGKVFCNKAAPNCRACPMREECEYALHNGPSLHGRKRTKVAAAAAAAAAQQDGGGGGGGGPEMMTVVSTPLPPGGWAPGLGPGGGQAAGGQRVHWKTLQRLQRQEQARLERERLYSARSPEELVAAAPSRPRTAGLRRPRGTPPEEAQRGALPRALAEMRALSAAAGRERAAAARSTRWLPIDLMRRSAADEPSAWDAAPPLAPEETAAADAAMQACGAALPGEPGAPLMAALSLPSQPHGLSAWDMAGCALLPARPPRAAQPGAELLLPAHAPAADEPAAVHVNDGVAPMDAAIPQGAAQAEAAAAQKEAEAAVAAVAVPTPGGAVPPFVAPDPELADAVRPALLETAEEGVEVPPPPLHEPPAAAERPGAAAGGAATGRSPLSHCPIPCTEEEIALECARLRVLGSEMAAVREAMALAEGRGDARVHRERWARRAAAFFFSPPPLTVAFECRELDPTKGLRACRTQHSHPPSPPLSPPAGSWSSACARWAWTPP